MNGISIIKKKRNEKKQVKEERRKGRKGGKEKGRKNIVKKLFQKHQGINLMVPRYFYKKFLKKFL